MQENFLLLFYEFPCFILSPRPSRFIFTYIQIYVRRRLGLRSSKFSFLYQPTDSDLRDLFFLPSPRPRLDCNIINTTDTTIIWGFFPLPLFSFSGITPCVLLFAVRVFFVFFWFVLHGSGIFSLLHFFIYFYFLFYILSRRNYFFLTKQQTNQLCTR